MVVSQQEDSQYVMTEEITRKNLVSFIIKHTNRKLKRYLRSSDDSSYRSIMKYRYPVKEGEACVHTDRESCVPELHSKNFLEFVTNPNTVSFQKLY